MSNMTQLVMAEVAGNTQTCYCPSSNALMACRVRGGGEDWGRGVKGRRQRGRSRGKRGEAPLRSEVMPPREGPKGVGKTLRRD